ncbi:TatD family hydrolase [Atopobium fossor]|uniref:TatD family hydrolase n=1 Tax=Atopobium fossor TaxID=39487 RepID=UPI000429FA9C|nr:TatD family hydrolase [Atopobium fossor]
MTTQIQELWAFQKEALHKAIRKQGVQSALGIFEENLFFDKKHRPVPAARPLAPVADTHGHLASYKKTTAAVALTRAALAGVHMLVVPLDPVDEIPRKFVTVAACNTWIDEQIEEAHILLDLCMQEGLSIPEIPGYEDATQLLDSIYVVAGAHPYSAQAYVDAPKQARAKLEEFLDSPRCVGIGEIGIDFGPYNELSAQVQKQILINQLHIAQDRELCVELHVRDAPEPNNAAAHELVLEALRETGIPKQGLELHCYTDGPQVLQPFIDQGVYVAFGGACTFKRSDDIREALAITPLNLILSETDSPYMAPVPLRGQECETAMIMHTVDSIAQVKEDTGLVTRKQTYQALWDNACKFFVRA